MNDVNNIRNDLIILGEYKNSSSKILCKCKNCGFEWYPTASSILSNRTRCPLCFASKGELKIGRWLQKSNIRFEMHKIFDDLCSERGKYLNYDFYIEDRKMLIEYQGEYHVKPHDKTEESYKKQPNNDDLKRNYA